ncbi:MAG: class I tRNA ligase family protein, partial [Candidatus Thorarchaeota archaeon]
RIPDILDVWLDSGSVMWAAQEVYDGESHYDTWVPADFILEGKDQIRGWFNTLLCSAMVSSGRKNYDACYMHGWTLRNKQKMSKSKGTQIFPEHLINGSLDELEKNKLNRFFEQKQKISAEEIRNTFSQVINNGSELKQFIKTLINLKIIEGYYSNIGFFYPFYYIKSKFLEDLNIDGSVSIKSFNFLPQNFIDKIIMDISLNQRLLKHKDQETYTSLKHIRKQINSEAAKKSVIELKQYRSVLCDRDFIELIKNMPREFLSEFHKGTQWLTNLGAQKISNEVQNSKVVGFFDITKLSEKLNIAELLLLDVFEQFVDFRSGIWNKNKNIFYYSKFIKDRINEINLVVDENEKIHQIEDISKELNIDKNHILSKIDENLQLIAEEIKQKDEIKLDKYLQKTGMELDAFLRFIDELDIFYFKKGNSLIFNPQKIEEAKNEIRYMLIDKSKSDDFISLGTMKFVQSTLIEELIKELLLDGKVKGIFHENAGELIFYTERGIRNLMLENGFLFSFHDLFYDKELKKEEIDLMTQIFEDLVIGRKLKGNFDEETLTFSSDEVLFAKDYNTVLFEFEKMVNSYIKNFEIEFDKIRNILTKREETIFPQEIKIIQETVDKINEKYVNWRSGLEAFIRRTNKKLLRDQGISVKQYKTNLPKDKKEEIKSLEEDPEVHDLLNSFNNWVKKYNKIELKYPNVIFYQKRLINNPDDKESNSKLNELLVELDLR